MTFVVFFFFFFFFQAEDGIRDVAVTGVQTCALPISPTAQICSSSRRTSAAICSRRTRARCSAFWRRRKGARRVRRGEIGRASCRERVEMSVGAGGVEKKEKKREERAESEMWEDR